MTGQRKYTARRNQIWNQLNLARQVRVILLHWLTMLRKFRFFKFGVYDGQWNNFQLIDFWIFWSPWLFWWWKTYLIEIEIDGSCFFVESYKKSIFSTNILFSWTRWEYSKENQLITLKINFSIQTDFFLIQKRFVFFRE